jgi:hypothetical protein
MATKENYEDIITGIESRGGFTTLRTSKCIGYNLICASRKTNEGLSGNSFWIWYRADTRSWFLATWSPRHYAVDFSADLVELCMTCLALDDRPIACLPDAVIAKFHLNEICDDDFEAICRS